MINTVPRWKQTAAAMPHSDCSQITQDSGGRNKKPVLGPLLVDESVWVFQQVSCTGSLRTNHAYTNSRRCSSSALPTRDDCHQVEVMSVRVIVRKDDYTLLK